MLLGKSPHTGDMSIASLLQTERQALGTPGKEHRKAFIDLIHRAAEIFSRE
jgi:hypothetical protein